MTTPPAQGVQHSVTTPHRRKNIEHKHKKTPFDDLTQAELDAIVKETDDTPMKQLEYKTPNEAWDEETSRLQSKTTNPSTSVALTS